MNKKDYPAWKRWLSYLFPFLIHQETSYANGRLEVWLFKGKLVLNTKNANYAFGSLHQLFQATFKKLHIKQRNPKEVLILGFGAGSIASILRNELNLNCNITGVEHDETILKLAEKYFNLKHFANLELHKEDAFDHVLSYKKQFDLIAIDLFEDIEVPTKFMSTAFLDACCQLLSPKGILVFNTIDNQEHKQPKVLLEHLEYNQKGKSKVLTLFTDNVVLVWERE